MPVEIWQISWFTILVASLATLIMMPFGIAVAWLLARWTFPGKTALETFVSLPLVLPPVATGLILLRLLARRGPVGRLLDNAGIEFLFTWKAVVLAMAVLGFPLLVRTARAGFEQVNQRYELVAQNHTYFHRVAKIFSELGLKRESDMCKETMAKHFEG